MAIFDRIRRARSAGANAAPEPVDVPQHLLPDINQRITVSSAGATPVPSRVEDRGAGALQLAFPAIELEFGDRITITWERDDAWFSLETSVTGIDARAAVPTILVAASGRLSRFDERRRDVRRRVELPIELRIVRARAIRAGRELHTHTDQVSADTLRFHTSATFAPGDVVEARVYLAERSTEHVTARLRVIRVDTVPGSWRTHCTAAFDEILRSDRARLLAVADSVGTTLPLDELTPPAAAAGDHRSEPTTLDGVGGRDEPRSASDLLQVLDWLQRSDASRNAAAPGDEPTR